ncbi:MAG: Flp family type IVb pilin [Novosphingobium sp.]|nr:Flp family type IVb pilin [Novosphingobium sp.]
MSKRSLWKDLAKDRRGATAIEYGLICGLIVIAIFVSIQSFANENMRTWNTVSNAVQNSVASGTGG